MCQLLNLAYVNAKGINGDVRRVVDILHMYTKKDVHPISTYHGLNTKEKPTITYVWKKKNPCLKKNQCLVVRASHIWVPTLVDTCPTLK